MSYQINAQVGQFFDVTVYAHAGTGYSWYLTALPSCAALQNVSESSVQPGLPGGAVRQTFTFLATSAGSGDVGVTLYRPWDPSQPGDKKNYSVIVTSGAEADMKAVAGKHSFAPVALANCEGDNAGQMIHESSTNCILKYGFPPNHPVVLKYGFPVIPAYAVQPPGNSASGPVIALYMVQPPIASK